MCFLVTNVLQSVFADVFSGDQCISVCICSLSVAFCSPPYHRCQEFGSVIWCITFFSQALKASGDVWWLSSTDSQEDMAYFNDPRYKITVDNDLKDLFRKTELPRDMLDIEKELKKSGEKPVTNTTKRRALAQIAAPKPKKSNGSKKQRRLTGKSRGITNIHMPELFDA